MDYKKYFQIRNLKIHIDGYKKRIEDLSNELAELPTSIAIQEALDKTKKQLARSENKLKQVLNSTDVSN